MNLTYEVVAGKYDLDELNIKYINTFDTLEEALDDVANKNLINYPWCEIEVHGALDRHKLIIDCRNPVYINTRT